MAAYNVHDAKTNLSKLLDQVLEGEPVLITQNGVPVAELGGSFAGQSNFYIADNDIDG